MLPAMSLVLAGWAVLPAAAPELLLVGTLVSALPARSAAVLRAEGRARVLLPGESAFGVRLLSVEGTRVTLERDGRRFELTLAAASTVAGPVAAWPAAAEPVGAVFERAELERRLAAETPRILAETALIPVSDEGRVVGFTLSRLPESGLLSEVGLQAGDVLTEVNGTPIDSLATLLALYGRLRRESEVRATVLRGGSAVTLSLRLR